MKRSLLCMGLFSMLIWNNSAFGNVVCWEEVNTTKTPTTSAIASKFPSGTEITEVSTEMLTYIYRYSNTENSSYATGAPMSIAYNPSSSIYNSIANGSSYNTTIYSYSNIYALAIAGGLKLPTFRHTYCIVANSSSGGGSSSASVNYIIKAS